MSEPIRTELLGLTPAGLAAVAIAFGFTRGKAQNLFRVLHQTPGTAPGRLPRVDPRLAALAETLPHHPLVPDGQSTQLDDGGTRKLLFKTVDGLPVEAVLMPRRGREGWTLCVSSQVGCRLGCTFCRTGQMGLLRNLTPGEIVDQVRHARASAGAPVSNLVFMGMGEPLENLDAVLAAIEVLRAPEAYAIPARRITVSTAGHLAGMERFTLKAPRVNLAVSVNAPTDALRDRIMPINRRYPLAGLVAAMRTHAARSRARVVAEYVLLAGVNDSPADAEALADLLVGSPIKVNLIRFNPVPGIPYLRPEPTRVDAFRARLEARGIDTLERYSWGSGIAAACGQLGAEVLASSPGTSGPGPQAAPALAWSLLAV